MKAHCLKAEKPNTAQSQSPPQQQEATLTVLTYGYDRT